MIRYLIFFIVLIFINNAYSRNIGETEITTEDGIEVFQKEKYYLLKKNVEIQADELSLKAQTVKIFFEQDLYDIIELIAKEDVNFVSDQFSIKGEGQNVEFKIKKQKISISGLKSKLLLENTEMFSDGQIKVDNLNGSFDINGKNSKLVSENILIIGDKINGKFEIINEKRDIANLIVEDDNKLNIKTDDIVMYANKAIYNKKKSVIELFENVEITRGNEIITGDYGILNTNTNSYKVSSSNSKKVKVIISNSNE